MTALILLVMDFINFKKYSLLEWFHKKVLNEFRSELLLLFLVEHYTIKTDTIRYYNMAPK